MNNNHFLPATKEFKTHKPFLLEERNINMKIDPTLFKLNMRKIKQDTIINPNTAIGKAICLRIISGINFCTLSKINISIYPTVGRILNSQEWRGGSPILNNTAKHTTPTVTLEAPPIRTHRIKIKDATLWEMKYFNPLSTESSLILTTKSGITESILTSKLTHWKNRSPVLKEIKIHTTNIRQ